MNKKPVYHQTSVRYCRPRFESLEKRELLSITPAEYSAICAAYSEFDLPVSMDSLNVVDIPSADVSVDSLKTAIADAGKTEVPDLIILRTGPAASSPGGTDPNTIDFDDQSDQIHIAIEESEFGALTILALPEISSETGKAWYETETAQIPQLTIDAKGFCSVISLYERTDNGGTFSYTSSDVNLGNLIITGGASNWVLSGGTARPGGGILNYNSSLVLKNCAVTDNTSIGYGGGIYNNYGYLHVYDSVISGNKCLKSDTAISSTASSPASSGQTLYADVMAAEVLEAEVLEAEQPFAFGGGLCNMNGFAYMNNSVVSGNRAFDGGGVYNIGLYEEIVTGVVLDKCTIDQNQAYVGGGIHNANATMIMDSSIVSNNKAVEPDENGTTSDGYGGGIYNYFGTMGIQQCKISGNTAVRSGGGMLNLCAKVYVFNTVLYGNESQVQGGAIAILGTNLEGASAELYNASAELYNVTIVDNKSGQVGGLFNQWASLKMYNSILVNNTSTDNLAAGFADIYSNVTVSAAGNLCSNNIGSGNYIYDNSKPLFTEQEGDYRLVYNSQTYSKGERDYVYSMGLNTTDLTVTLAEPTFDLAGAVRVQGSGVEIGAYEFDLETVPVSDPEVKLVLVSESDKTNLTSNLNFGQTVPATEKWLKYTDEWSSVVCELWINTESVEVGDFLRYKLQFDSSIYTTYQCVSPEGLTFEQSEFLNSNTLVLTLCVGQDFIDQQDANPATVEALVVQMTFSGIDSSGKLLPGVDAADEYSPWTISVVSMAEIPVEYEASVDVWSVPYDMDDDGKVSMSDFIAFAREFGKSSDCTADFNGTSKVDMQDFILFAQNFNRSARVQSLINIPKQTAHYTPVEAELPVFPEIKKSITLVPTETYSAATEPVVQESVGVVDSAAQPELLATPPELLAGSVWQGRVVDRWTSDVDLITRKYFEDHEQLSGFGDVSDREHSDFVEVQPFNGQHGSIQSLWESEEFDFDTDWLDDALLTERLKKDQL